MRRDRMTAPHGEFSLEESADRRFRRGYISIHNAREQAQAKELRADIRSKETGSEFANEMGDSIDTEFQGGGDFWAVEAGQDSF